MCPAATTTTQTGSTIAALCKRALLIGIRTYENGANLLNPENDVIDMHEKLERIGFDVQKHINLTSHKMNRIICDFTRSISLSDLVLFYFAGHGTQWEDQNYLIPTNNKHLTKDDITERAINVQLVLDGMVHRRPLATLFFLDCCRTYHKRHPALPRSGSVRIDDEIVPQGLKPMPKTAGSLVVFACAAGTVSSDGTENNGLFTKHLLDYITSPKETIEDILKKVILRVSEESKDKQVPYYTSCLTQNIYLNAMRLTGKIN